MEITSAEPSKPVPPPPPGSSTWRDMLTGALGFILGGIALLLVAFLGGRLLPINSLLGMLPQEQLLQKLLWGIFLFLFLLFLGGVAQGVLVGLTLARIDRLAPRRRYIVAGVVTFGLLQALLLLVFILILALLYFYNNNADVRARGLAVLFGGYGLLYGLLIGLLLGLTSVGWRHFWRVMLAAIFGYLLGGVATGLLLWLSGQLAGQGYRIAGLLFLLGAVVALHFFGGALLGWEYHRLARKRQAGGTLPAQVSLVWRWIGIAVGVLILLAALSVATRLTRFVAIKPGSLSTTLPSKTAGVAWQAAVQVPGAVPDHASLPSLASAPDGYVAVAWVQGSADEREVYISFAPLDSAGVLGSWSSPLNVSGTSSNASLNPQVVNGGAGVWHLAWTEAAPSGIPPTVYYSRCSQSACSTPAPISDASSLPCAPSAASPGAEAVWPVIAMDGKGKVMVAWHAGQGVLLYNTWQSGLTPSAGASGCIPNPAAPDGPDIGLSLVANRAGSFFLAYALQSSREIMLQQYNQQTWQPVPASLGVGFAPALSMDIQDALHTAWCGVDNLVNYRAAPFGNIETLDGPPCSSAPAISQDGTGRLHLVWYSSQVEKSTGAIASGSFIYDSLRMEQGWSVPALAARTAGETRPALMRDSLDTLRLAWNDALSGAGMLLLASQPAYRCLDVPLSRASQAILDIMTSGVYRPADDPVAYCHNTFESIFFSPNPPPTLPGEEASLNGSYDDVARAVSEAGYEVDFATMEYVSDVNADSPGFLLGETVVELYNRLKQDPARYPRGLTVRILLGNYPELSSFEWGQQIWNVLEDLKSAGLPELANPELGWKVDVANFDGQFPHSHTKFIIIDGKTAAAAGFNYSYLHYSDRHPSGLGISLVDLALELTGPVAQMSLDAFDDLWEGANQVQCDNMDPILGMWNLACTFTTGQATHVPEVRRYTLPQDGGVAFSMFRNTNFPESDKAVSAAIRSAQTSLDIFEVNFSLELQCALGAVFPDICTFDNSLEWMRALVDTIEQHHIPVRILVTDVNMNGIENKVAIRVLRDELARRGLEGYVEIRYFDGRMHTKSLLIDDELLIVGSQNFHYSAFGDAGLAEYNLATEDTLAITEYQRTYDYYWEQAIPVE
jgi:phosphatidylserine/phosphatidylglycerophosphate/cardiolipin synthase-like enzyme